MLYVAALVCVGASASSNSAPVSTRAVSRATFRNVVGASVAAYSVMKSASPAQANANPISPKRSPNLRPLAGHQDSCNCQNCLASKTAEQDVHVDSCLCNACLSEIGSASDFLLAAAAAEDAGDADPGLVASLVSGAATRVAKEALLHPFDTVRARMQVPSSEVGTGVGLYDDLYSGVIPALVTGVPAGALFFAVKDSSKKKLKSLGFTKQQSTLLSVLAANIPYWVVRTPSEALKTSRQTRGGTLGEQFSELKEEGLGEAYRSYSSNFAYALPADVVKFLAYETLAEALYGRNRDGQKLGGAQAAVVGAMAGLLAQAVSTPLDVARTRIMTKEMYEDDSAVGVMDDNATDALTTDSVKMMGQIWAKEGPKGLFAGITPRLLRAVGSGAVQFATYESSQNMFRK